MARKEQSRSYYERNAERIKAKSRAWSADNAERKRATRRAYYLANREAIKTKARAWELANPERKRARNRARRFLLEYGITLAQFDEMLALQHGGCAICEAPVGTGRETHVDHDHSTGKVRALLCGPCNRGVGVLEKQSGSWLPRAQIYLARHRTDSVLEIGMWRGDAPEAAA